MSVAQPLGAASARLRGAPGRPRKAGAPSSTTIPSLPPRLLDLHGIAAYLAIRERKARELVAAGVVPRVHIPLPRGGEVKKILVDREDLDRLVSMWKA